MPTPTRGAKKKQPGATGRASPRSTAVRSSLAKKNTPALATARTLDNPSTSSAVRTVQSGLSTGDAGSVRKRATPWPVRVLAAPTRKDTPEILPRSTSKRPRIEPDTQEDDDSVDEQATRRVREEDEEDLERINLREERRLKHCLFGAQIINNYCVLQSWPGREISFISTRATNF